MATGDIKIFTINQSGFSLSIEVIDLGDGTSQCNITSLLGEGDLNAIWWSDNDAQIEGSVTLSKSDSSLNMNGTQVVWDGYEWLSSTGLGKLGESKDTFLSQGETLSFAVDVDWADVTILGVRATSVNGSDSIKGVDTGADQIIDAPTVSINDVTVTEGGKAEFTVSLSSAYPYDIKVQYTTQDGSATSGSDYTGASGYVIIPAGQLSASVCVETIDDNVFEANETFTIKLSNATADIPGPDILVTIQDDTGTGTITNDDPVPTASIAVSPNTVAEDGATNLVYTVTLSNPSAFATTVNYTVGGSATNGTDYGSVSGSIVIAAGSTSGTITVDPTVDNIFEADETVIVTLTGGDTNATPILIHAVDNQATGTISNDDPEPVVNRAPTASDDVIVISGQTTIFVPAAWLLGNDTDPDGDSLSITAPSTVGGLSGGMTVTPVVSGTVITGFTVSTSGTGASNTISYEISDGQGHTSTAQFTIQTPSTQSNNGPNTISLSALTYNYSYIDSQAGNDTVTANLNLFGTQGNDWFIGGSGADRLDAGAGDNILTGGLNDDTFVFRNFSGMTNKVTDFDAGTSITTIDKLQFEVVPGVNPFSVGDNDTVVDNFKAGNNATINVAGTEVAVKTDASVTNATVQSTINGYGNITTGAFFVFHNLDLGHAAVYYDSNPSGAGGAVLVAELENISNLTGLANFNAGDFQFV